LPSCKSGTIVASMLRFREAGFRPVDVIYEGDDVRLQVQLAKQRGGYLTLMGNACVPSEDGYLTHVCLGGVCMQGDMHGSRAVTSVEMRHGASYCHRRAGALGLRPRDRARRAIEWQTRKETERASKPNKFARQHELHCAGLAITAQAQDGYTCQAAIAGPNPAFVTIHL